MGTFTTLPDDLVWLLAETYGETNPATQKRWTLQQLAAFASERIGRPVTRPVVERAIAPLRAEWARMAAEVARERIGQKLPAQLEKFDDMLTKVGNDFAGSKTAGARAAALDAYRKGLLLKLRFSGIGERVEVDGDLNVDGTVTLADARSQLAARLAGAAYGAVASGASGRSGEPDAGGGGDPPP